MLLAQIKNIAGDCQSTHRWAKVNLTGDDQHNDYRSPKLTQARIIWIGRKKVRLMRANGKVVSVDPFFIQQAW